MIRTTEDKQSMDENKRPETMERITTPQLAQEFIDREVEAVRNQVKDG